MDSLNNVHAFMHALADGAYAGTFNATDNELEIVDRGGDKHVVSLDWLGNQVVAPAELTEEELAIARPKAMSMSVGDGFTWNDYVRELWSTITAPYRAV